MPQSVIEPKTRPHPGTRPIALLTLAFGVAIGGGMAGTPVPAVDRAASARTSGAPIAVANDFTLAARKTVRVIPLPVRDRPSALGR